MIYGLACTYMVQAGQLNRHSYMHRAINSSGPQVSQSDLPLIVT
jgi:hypothetical protein